MKFSQLNRCVIPAIPAWFRRRDQDIFLDISSNQQYIEKLLKSPVGGVAALVHTGRGSFLSNKERDSYLRMCVDTTHKLGKIVITGVNTIEQSKQAADLGVDAVLVFPNRAELPGLDHHLRKKKILDYHREIARYHPNCIVFLLYEDTGIGIVYTEDEIQELMQIENITGIKFALLSDFERLEDFLTSIYAIQKDICIFTGEDRMFAESIEKCRDLAFLTKREKRINSLIGLGSALPWLQTFMLQVFDKPKYQKDYFRTRSIISELARYTFVRPMDRQLNRKSYNLPMEPYVKNMSIASGIQFKIDKALIGDITRIKKECKRREIPDNLHNIVSDYDFQTQRQKISDIMNKGLLFESEIKNKFGKNLEKLTKGE